MGNFQNIFQWLPCLLGDRRGSASTEFALTFPIYLATILFMVEIGRLTYTQGVIIHAAEEAGRYALVHYDATETEVEALAQSNLLGLDPDNLTAIIVTAPTDPVDQTKLITVEVRYQYTPILPLGALLSDDGISGINLTGTSSGFITQEIPGS